MNPSFVIRNGAETAFPLIAVALHAGHEVREDIADVLAVDGEQRLREEDPFTNLWTSIAPYQVVVHRSRFEVDLDRHRSMSIYETPADAWGLRLWRRDLTSEQRKRSLRQYDAFYAAMRQLLDEMVLRFGRFVLLDLHAYNHRRQGPGEPADDPQSHPDINVGTGALDKGRWGSVVDRFLRELRNAPYPGRHLDARENVRFRGGHFADWVHRTYPGEACPLVVSVKKFFMDEWTGKANWKQVAAVRRALETTVPGILETIGHWSSRTARSKSIARSSC